MIMSWVGVATGTTIGRLQDVVLMRASGFLASACASTDSGKVNSHLVTIEVSVERSTDKWVAAG